SRLIGAQADPRRDENHIDPVSGRSQDAYWYAWHDDGSLAARRRHGDTYIPSVQRDASGLPIRFGSHRLAYGPQRRLTQIFAHGTLAAAADQASKAPARDEPSTGTLLARYAHNA